MTASNWSPEECWGGIALALYLVLVFSMRYVARPPAEWPRDTSNLGALLHWLRSR